MDLPDFVLSLDGMSVIRIREPAFELREISEREMQTIPFPHGACETADGRLFGVVKWLSDPDGLSDRDIANHVTVAIEHLFERWAEAAIE